MPSYFNISELETTLGDFRLGPVSLEIEKGDYVVLLGPTGCGKSTLIKCIIGVLGIENGKISLGDNDIGALPPNKRRVGYVAQITDLFPHMTVEENIAFGLKYLKLTSSERKDRLGQYLDLFGLQNLKNRPATKLSGGESKKVSLARSLIVEPKLLLLDEPVGMLDHNERNDILKILRMVHSELGMTTLHVTHDRHEAWSCARTCAVMNAGRILETGPLAKIFRAPSSRFVAEFLGGANIFKASFDGNKARTAWGSVTLAEPPPGSEGWLMIRPEQIILTGEEDRHTVSGKVAAVRDFGEYVELEVSVEDSNILTVHASVEKASGVGVGREVFLYWPESAVHAIAGEG
ncbi:MAG: ABC transporter ATP-binding protein [Planctomycetota bacterium]|nr:MAG: ABC transporter ATP-binding protein [Planctomycetota bacterium]